MISDNGSGIDPGIRDTCFELGEHGPHSDGEGIGLYLVSPLAYLYDGAIELEKSPSGGAQFDIRFPVSGSVAADTPT